MRAAKTFFYVAAGILALAVAFQMGAQTAESQSPIVATSITNRGSNPADGFYVLAENGDVYYVGNPTGWNPTQLGNVFGGGPVQATETTWGRIKAERR
jgi:hypothetical protein